MLERESGRNEEGMDSALLFTMSVCLRIRFH